MTDFKQSAWADYRFAQNYLDKADIYIVERRKMFWFVSSDTLGNQLSALEAAGFADWTVTIRTESLQRLEAGRNSDEVACRRHPLAV